MDGTGSKAESNKPEIANDLGQIHEIMFALGWVNKKENPFNAHSIKKQISTAEILAWKRGLRDGKVIHEEWLKRVQVYTLTKWNSKAKAIKGPLL